MIDKIYINNNRTVAVIYFETHNVYISHDEGKVLDLLIFILTPNINNEVTYNSFINSLQDTAIINLSQIETRKVA